MNIIEKGGNYGWRRYGKKIHRNFIDIWIEGYTTFTPSVSHDMTFFLCKSRTQLPPPHKWNFQIFSITTMTWVSMAVVASSEVSCIGTLWRISPISLFLSSGNVDTCNKDFYIFADQSNRFLIGVENPPNSKVKRLHKFFIVFFLLWLEIRLEFPQLGLLCKSRWVIYVIFLTHHLRCQCLLCWENSPKHLFIRRRFR